MCVQKLDFSEFKFWFQHFRTIFYFHFNSRANWVYLLRASLSPCPLLSFPPPSLTALDAWDSGTFLLFPQGSFLHPDLCFKFSDKFHLIIFQGIWNRETWRKTFLVQLQNKANLVFIFCFVFFLFWVIEIHCINIFTEPLIYLWCQRIFLFSIIYHFYLYYLGWLWARALGKWC